MRSSLRTTKEPSRARAADRALKRGEHGGYSWRSFTVKENNDVEGLPTTVGNPKSKDFVANCMK